jgi:hypothetical protein
MRFAYCAGAGIAQPQFAVVGRRAAASPDPLRGFRNDAEKFFRSLPGLIFVWYFSLDATTASVTAIIFH